MSGQILQVVLQDLLLQGLLLGAEGGDLLVTLKGAVIGGGLEPLLGSEEGLEVIVAVLDLLNSLLPLIQDLYIFNLHILLVIFFIVLVIALVVWASLIEMIEWMVMLQLIVIVRGVSSKQLLTLLLHKRGIG